MEKSFDDKSRKLGDSSNKPQRKTNLKKDADNKREQKNSSLFSDLCYLLKYSETFWYGVIFAIFLVSIVLWLTGED